MRGAGSILVLGLAACDPVAQDVEIQGVARDGAQGDGLAGVTVTALSLDETELDRTLSEASGWYRLEVPRRESFVHVTLSGEGLRTTSFGGDPGENPRVRVPNNQSVAITDERWADLLETWSGCPGLGERGAMFGTVQIADLIEEDGDSLPVTTGDVRVELPDGSVRAACYLGEDGSYDPDASVTGERATFLIPDLPGETLRLNVTWRPVETESVTEEYAIWVPDGGIATTFPLLVDAPFQVEF